MSFRTTPVSELNQFRNAGHDFFQFCICDDYAGQVQGLAAGFRAWHNDTIINRNDDRGAPLRSLMVCVDKELPLEEWNNEGLLDLTRALCEVKSIVNLDLRARLPSSIFRMLLQHLGPQLEFLRVPQQIFVTSQEDVERETQILCSTLKTMGRLKNLDCSPGVLLFALNSGSYICDWSVAFLICGNCLPNVVEMGFGGLTKHQALLAQMFASPKVRKLCLISYTLPDLNTGPLLNMIKSLPTTYHLRELEVGFDVEKRLEPASYASSISGEQSPWGAGFLGILAANRGIEVLRVSHYKAPSPLFFDIFLLELAKSLSKQLEASFKAISIIPDRDHVYGSNVEDAFAKMLQVDSMFSSTVEYLGFADYLSLPFQEQLLETVPRERIDFWLDLNRRGRRDVLTKLEKFSLEDWLELFSKNSNDHRALHYYVALFPVGWIPTV